MPCHSDPSDAADALLVARHLGIPYKTVDLTEPFDTLTAAMEERTQKRETFLGSVFKLFSERSPERSAVSKPTLTEMARANLKARLRMVTLYGVAQSTFRLVCGTGNRSEWEVGYFTKYGDAGSDMLPLLELLKCEVRAMARWLGLPEKIVARAPTAGLWAGQTDEGEMGFTYDELDHYLATGEASPETLRKIEALRAKSEHKRRAVPFCKIEEL
jgi:NAD+ synthase